MGLKKKGATAAGGTVGAAIGTVTVAPILTGLFAALGGPAAPITGPIGYGLGCLITGALGGIIGKKVGDVVDDEEESR